MKTKSENKTQATKSSVKDFLLTVPEQQRKDSETLIRLMRKISGKSPVMWGPSIIGFDKCHYKYASGREGDMSMLGFSPRKANLTIYFADGLENYESLFAKLGPHKTSQVCLYVKRLSDIDISVLEKALKACYKYAVAHKDNMYPGK